MDRTVVIIRSYRKCINIYRIWNVNEIALVIIWLKLCTQSQFSLEKWINKRNTCNFIYYHNDFIYHDQFWDTKFGFFFWRISSILLFLRKLSHFCVKVWILLHLFLSLSCCRITALYIKPWFQASLVYLMRIVTAFGLVWSTTSISWPFLTLSFLRVSFKFGLVRSSILFTVDMYSVLFFPSRFIVTPVQHENYARH